MIGTTQLTNDREINSALCLCCEYILPWRQCSHWPWTWAEVVWSRVCLWASRDQGRNWVILGGGRRYIYNMKDEIVHGLSPSVKCVAPLLRDNSLDKVFNAGGGARTTQPPLPQLRLWAHWPAIGRGRKKARHWPEKWAWLNPLRMRSISTQLSITTSIRNSVLHLDCDLCTERNIEINTYRPLVST